MKKHLFLFVIVMSLVLFSRRTHTRRYLPRTKSVELYGGSTNDLKSPLNYYTESTIPRYTPKANRWVMGAEYSVKNYGYRNTSVPRMQFTAEGGHYLKSLSNPTKTILLLVGGSALTGYKTINWGDRMLFDGSVLLAEDVSIYGGAMAPELEACLTNCIVLLADTREYVL